MLLCIVIVIIIIIIIIIMIIIIIHDLSETWVKENIGSHLNRLYTKWLLLPISVNITHLQMPQNKLHGLNITSAKKLYDKCKLSVRRILKTSPNLEARKL